MTAGIGDVRRGRKPPGALLRPALAVMNRLKYPWKFALISLLFALPLAVTMFFLIQELDDRVDFSDKEIRGDKYLRPMRKLLEHVTESRRLAYLYGRYDVTLRPELIKKQDQIDRAFEELEIVDRELGKDLKTTGEFRVLRENWQFLKSQTAELLPAGTSANQRTQAAAVDGLHIKLIAGIRALISLAGDTSNLILDPDLDTYYLMDVVLLKLPQGQDLLQQTRLRGEDMLRAGKPLTAEQRAELIALAGLVDSNIKETQRSLEEKAFLEENNPAANLKPALGQPLKETSNAVQNFIRTLNVEVIQAESIKPGRLQVFDEAAQQAVHASFGLWDRTVTELDGLLQARIDRFATKKHIVEVFAVLMLIVAAYLLVAFYSAVMRTVHSLEDASKRMVGGEMTGGVTVETRDELGQVAQSFNSIAGRLRTEWAQAQEESARARAAEGALRESEERNRLIVDTALDAVITMDAQGRITGWNRQAKVVFGWSQNEALGKVLAELIIPLQHREAHGRGLKHFLASGEGSILNKRIEITALHRDGHEFPVELSIAPPVRTRGAYTFSAFVRDITERKTAEEELRKAKEDAEEANRAKSRFLANMSHELRTPLNAIIGYSEMLKEEVADLGQESLVPDLQKVHSAGRHLLTLINDILDLSKIEAGRMELYLETFDVADMIRDVATTIRPLVEKNANQLEIQVPDDIGTMQGDLTRVRQCLFNLLSNACKFTERGTITLQAERRRVQDQDWIKLCVRDTGIGMTPEQLERLFQAFTQADASTTRKYGGTGLGLAISQKFCQMMGGEIRAHSEAGKGSTFTIDLPICTGEASGTGVTPVLPEPAHADVPTDGLNTILVIDDDPTVHDLMTRYLSREGFRVVTAQRGEDGLRLAKELQPCVITLDVVMPGMDGWAVLTALKNDAATADIPVIMLTMVDNKSMGYALGVAEYLTKPIDRDRLSTVLRKFRCQTPPCPVLIVEDDASTRDMISRTLEKEGWTVSEAENGRTGLVRLAAMKAELILLDLMMPEMDGFEFLRELRKNEEWQSIPVVVVTAKDLTEQDRQRLNGYVQKILQKGAYSREELLREVRIQVARFVRSRGPGRQEAAHAQNPAG